MKLPQLKPPLPLSKSLHRFTVLSLWSKARWAVAFLGWLVVASSLAQGTWVSPAHAQVPRLLGLSAPELLANAGDEITVSVQITKRVNVDALAAVKLCLRFDSSVLAPVDAQLGAQMADAVDGFTASFAEGEACIGLSTSDPVSIDLGELVSFTLQVKPLVAPGTVTSLELGGPLGQEIVLLASLDELPPGIKPEATHGSVEVQAGFVCIPPEIAGDANEDGVLNAADAILVLRYAAELEEPTEEELCAADANESGEVNTGDAIWILRAIVGLPNKAPGLAEGPTRGPAEGLVEGRAVHGAAPDGGPRARLLSTDRGVRLVVEEAGSLHGLDVDWTYDPARFHLGELPAADEGLRIEAESVAGRRLVRWASTRPVAPDGSLQLDQELTRVLPRGDQRLGTGLSGDAIELTRVVGYDAWGRTVFVPIDGARSLRGPTPGAEGDRPASRPTVAVRLSGHPNPFNPSTTLSFDVPRSGLVTLRLFDASGRRVRTLLREHRASGAGQVQWNGRDDAGRPVTSGVYYARLETAAGAAVQRLILVK